MTDSNFETQQSQGTAPKEVGGNKSEPSRLAWSRYFARIIDLAIYGYIASLAIVFMPFQFLGPDDVSLQLTALVYLSVLIVLLEPILLTCFGTTIGKYGFGLTVTKNKKPTPTNQDPSRIYAIVPEPVQNISYWTFVRRNLGLLTAGLGLLIPIVTLYTMARSRRILIAEGATPWDKRHDMNVVRESYSPVNFLFFVGSLVLALAFHFSPILNFSTFFKQEYSPKHYARNSPVSWQNPVTSAIINLPPNYMISDEEEFRSENLVGQFTDTKNNSIYVALYKQTLKSPTTVPIYVDAFIKIKKDNMPKGTVFYAPESAKINHVDVSRFVANKREDGESYSFEFVVWTNDNRTFWHTVAFTDTQRFNLGVKGRDLVEHLIQSTASFSH